MKKASHKPADNPLGAIIFVEKIGSTNDLARAPDASGAAHGACWAADAQLGGRGRRELGGERRSWFSPPGVNIYMSILLRPQIEAQLASGLTLASAVAICRLLRQKTGADIWVKWPNDLYIGSKKICGILSEASWGQSGIDSVVVGVGLNVNLERPALPADLRDIATSLKIETGQTFDRLELLAALRRALVETCDAFAARGFPAILQELRAYDRTNGRQIRVARSGEWVNATARGIDDTGGLRVEIDGKIQVVQAGEVRFR